MHGHVCVHIHLRTSKECDVIDKSLTDMLFKEEKQMPTSGESLNLRVSVSSSVKGDYNICFSGVTRANELEHRRALSAGLA